MTESRKLTVVIDQLSWDNIRETQFFSDVLLGGLERPVVFKLIDRNPETELHDDILIINLANNLTPLIYRTIQRGYRNVGLVSWTHSGAEHREMYPFVDYILRPFFSPESLALPPGGRCQDVVWFPIGYQSGVGPRRHDLLPGFDDRTFDFFYAGCPNTNYSDRLQMLAAAQHGDLPVKLILTEGFSEGLSIPTYRTHMENTRFALVPAGTDAETIRLFEALELGCIPITLNYAFLQDPRAMAGAPVVRLNAWEELPMWYQMVRSAPDYSNLMEGFRQNVSRWWQDFKLTEQRKIADVINRSFGRY